VRERVANLPARSVRYLEAGSGTPVVLLHAFPLNAEQWLGQMARVPPGIRVIAPDTRGFDGRDPFAGLPAGVVTMETYARDVTELLTHLEIGRAIIGGLSMGGYIALAMVRHVPDRVSGLVLADTRASADTDEVRQTRDRMIDLAGRQGAPAVATAMMPKLIGPTTRREQPDLADAVRRLIESNTRDGIISGIRAMRSRPDSTELLGRLACPVAIICGEEDEITPVAEHESLQRAIPGARLAVIPRAGHLSNLERPLVFNDALYSSVTAINHGSASR
jgi:3-oxoadipate enol-lactonase